MRILSITAKCSDLCNTSFTDAKGIEHESDSYVPEDIGIGGGDYVELEIDMETGQIQNWKSVSDAQIIRALKEA
jgi:hypothetical protein